MRDLTPRETAVIEMLEAANAAFYRLPGNCSDDDLDEEDFSAGMRQAYNVVLARPAAQARIG